MDKKTAIHRYLEIASSTSYFGMTFFEVKDGCMIGVAQDGLFTFNLGSLVCTISDRI